MDYIYKAGYPGGGIGRHAGLKILFAAMRVTVRLRSRVLIKKAANMCNVSGFSALLHDASKRY